MTEAGAHRFMRWLASGLALGQTIFGTFMALGAVERIYRSDWFNAVGCLGLVVWMAYYVRNELAWIRELRYAEELASLEQRANKEENDAS